MEEDVPSTWTFSAVLCWRWKISEAMQQSLSCLLGSVNVDTVSEELQMELIELQSDSQLQNKFRALPLLDFYTCFPADRYAKIRRHAQVMLSLFGSTYLCEQASSLMNVNKCKLRNSLSDSHLQDILTLSVSQLDVERLLKNRDMLHVSHWYCWYLLFSVVTMLFNFIFLSISTLEYYKGGQYSCFQLNFLNKHLEFHVLSVRKVF